MGLNATLIAHVFNLLMLFVVIYLIFSFVGHLKKKSELQSKNSNKIDRLIEIQEKQLEILNKQNIKQND